MGQGLYPSRTSSEQKILAPLIWRFTHIRSCGYARTYPQKSCKSPAFPRFQPGSRAFLQKIASSDAAQIALIGAERFSGSTVETRRTRVQMFCLLLVCRMHSALNSFG